MSRMSSLAGRVAVVTGGASGIGKGIAKAMIAEGAQVVIADIEALPLQATAEEIGAVGIRVDVTHQSEVEALAKQVGDQFGRIDILVNNAGVAPKVRIQDATIDDWRWVIDVNLWGVIYGVKAFLPYLLENPNGGHVMNVSSAGGLVTGPMLGTYSVTKSGVIALSEALSLELNAAGANVGVTVLCPGQVRTNLQTSSRNRPPELSDAKAIDIDLLKNSKLAGGREQWITADSAGVVAVDAIKRNALYATTHPLIADYVEMRAAKLVEALRHPIPKTEPLPAE
jgi:NAD(P)-dependent dehydrogenase (short-subunit alcohol dehydrogenase family)